MQIEPLFGRIIIESVKEDPQLTSIIVPFANRRDRGKIINCGNSDTFKVGDIVLYDMRAARVLKLDMKEYISLEAKDILCILETEE